MDGITKVIDELGLLIITKEIEIESQQEKLDKLKKKIDALEEYLKAYEEFYNNKPK